MILRRVTTLWQISKSTGSLNIEESRQATLELLALLFFSVNVGYVAWLAFREFWNEAFLTLAYSILFLVLVPASRKLHFTSLLKLILIYGAGLPFAVINVFFCGPGYAIQVILWVVFAVNISFLILPIAQAFLFGVLVTALIITKQYMLYYGYDVNMYLLPKRLIESPDFIDILVPAFFNLAATSTYYKLYQNSLKAALSAGDQIKDVNLKLTETMVTLAAARHKAEESDRLKTVFLASMSHELKTPLNAIMGFSEILTRPTIDDKKRVQYADQIQIGSKKLFNMIVDILDYSKLETGSTLLIETQGKVTELIDRAIASAYTDRILLGKPVKLINATVLKTTEESITADFLKLYQVLANLIHNAIKFTTSGEITIKAVRKSEMIEFTVSDTGIGISSDNLERIFEPFTHGNDFIHGQYGGKGLGLTICRGLVNQWGGKIWVESILNQGTVVYFTLPVKTA